MDVFVTVCLSVFLMHVQALVQNNLLSDRITVISGKIEEIDLPEMVDVVISEPMGYMLFNERMLETFLHAKKWLKPDGMSLEMFWQVLFLIYCNG